MLRNEGIRMNIVGVTACTAGIAHTYIVAQKIQEAAEQAGHVCKIETQGTIGADNVLTDQDIANADVVIIAHDIVVNLNRFSGKRVVDIPISVAMKNPKSLIATIEKKLTQ